MVDLRRVLKIDRYGVIVETYPSLVEAAKHEYADKSSIRRRCEGMVNDAFRLTGYDYQWEDEVRRTICAICHNEWVVSRYHKAQGSYICPKCADKIRRKQNDKTK